MLDCIRAQIVVEVGQRLHDRILGDDLAGAHEQELQEAELTRRDLDRHSRRGETPRCQIQRDLAVTDDGSPQSRLPPQENPHACLEFADVERLDQIIVGTEIQTLDPFFRRTASRQDENRRTILPCPHGAQHVQPVHFRQVQIQDHEVETLCRSDRMRRCAVAHDIDGIAAAAQKR